VLKLSLVPLLLAALVSVFFGIRYLLTREYMPYHAVVAGKAWSQLEAGVQTAIRGMLRIVGGGILAYGVALLWLLLPLNRGEPWAALTISAAILVPTLYVTIMLHRFQPKAKTPIVPTAIVIALVLAGLGTSFFI
jgi:uncharacterized protein YjeT (DUF2065 family)